MPSERVSAQRLTLLPLVLSPLPFLGIGVWVLEASLVFGVLFLAVFGAFLLYALAELVLPPAVVLSPAGIEARTLGTVRRFGWAECSDFHVWREGRRSVVAFGYGGSGRGRLSERDARRAQADRALPPLPGVSGEALLARIEDYRRRLTAPSVPAEPSPPPAGADDTQPSPAPAGADHAQASPRPSPTRPRPSPTRPRPSPTRPRPSPR